MLIHAAHLSNQVDSAWPSLGFDLGQDHLTEMTGARRTAGEDLIQDDVGESQSMELLEVLLAGFSCAAGSKSVSRRGKRECAERTCW